GQVLTISGEAGVGKTRLAHELARRGADLGYTVMWAQGAELQSENSFGLISGAFEPLLRRIDVSQYVDHAGQLAQLSALFPSFAGDRSLDSAAPPASRPGLYRSVRVLLEQLTVGSPVVLIFDDVHWGDSASLELIGHLL